MTTKSRTFLTMLTLGASLPVFALDPNCQLYAEKQVDATTVNAICELAPTDPNCEVSEEKALREKQIEALRANCELSDDK